MGEATFSPILEVDQTSAKTSQKIVLEKISNMFSFFIEDKELSILIKMAKGNLGNVFYFH